MSSPGSGFNRYFYGSPVTLHGQFLFYLLSFIGDLSNYLNFIRWYGNIAHCKPDVILNTIRFCVEQKFSQSPSVTHMSRGFFSILGNTWTDRRNRMIVERVKSELCTKFNFDTTFPDFLDFLNKPEQVELLKSVSKNKSIRRNKTCFQCMWFYL
jgi:hypothetical protein